MWRSQAGGRAVGQLRVQRNISNLPNHKEMCKRGMRECGNALDGSWGQDGERLFGRAASFGKLGFLVGMLVGAAKGWEGNPTWPEDRRLRRDNASEMIYCGITGAFLGGWVGAACACTWPFCLLVPACYAFSYVQSKNNYVQSKNN
jgi:hypothetical protein